MSIIQPVDPDDNLKFLPDYEYFNIVVNNNTDQSIYAQFEQQRDTAILADMENYEVSVVRFRVPTSEIPIFIFETGTYFLRFGTTTSSPVVYAGQFVGNRNVTNAIYQYWQFIEMVNNAIDANLVANGQAVLVGTIYFELNRDTDKLRLIVRGVPANAYLIANPLIMNQSLYNFFTPIDASQITNTDYQLNYYIASVARLNSSVYILASPNIYSATLPVTFLEGAYNNLYTWHTLRKLIFTTGSLPVRAEQLGSNLTLGGTPATLAIITDFNVPPEDSGSLDHSVFFADEDARVINITGYGILKKLDVKIYYQTRDLNLFQLLIGPSLGFEIKLRFRRRKSLILKQY